MNEPRHLLPMQETSFGSAVVFDRPFTAPPSGLLLISTNTGYGLQPCKLILPHQLYRDWMDTVRGEIHAHVVGEGCMVRKA